ncbi:helix-turn-helix domain-containing protein [Actinomadura hibisca]|uniref:helix-turn-helix domain-containing protein n=1 Tax=Actinomadura hibisca TaxID=68565 RepID=UPI00083633EA|nr:helix-turn-helix domain-containing protein [Actinomadura hibisca]
MPSGPLTPDEHDRIRALHAEGLSRNAIARELGRSMAAVSAAAERMGLEFDRARTRAATKAKQIDAKAKRAQLSLDLLNDGERLRTRLWEPTEVVVSTPKGPVRVTLPLPPARDARDIMAAVHTAIRGHADLERLDSDSGADAAKSMLGQLGEALQLAANQINGTGEEA